MKFVPLGLALIVATNAIVLAGVAYNRSGEAEATLRLTERELVLADYGLWADEKSGISLRVQWRLPHRDTSRSANYYYGSWGGEAAWLDERKLRELGYDQPPAGMSDERRGRREQERSVYLALEMDGPAYQVVLKLAQDAAAKERAGDKPKNAYESAVDWLKREERSASRLFVVDAGLDASALRAKYPDRGRYAIVEGRVRPYYRANARGLEIAGHVTAINVPSINVPVEVRSLFTSLREVPHRQHGENTPRYAVDIAYGRRLEPRLAMAARLARSD